MYLKKYNIYKHQKYSPKEIKPGFKFKSFQMKFNLLYIKVTIILPFLLNHINLNIHLINLHLTFIHVYYFILLN